MVPRARAARVVSRSISIEFDVHVECADGVERTFRLTADEPPVGSLPPSLWTDEAYEECDAAMVASGDERSLLDIAADAIRQKYRVAS